MSMAKDMRTGKYLWATEIWHKRLLNYNERPGGLSRFFSGGSSSFETDDSEALDDK